MAKLTIGQKAQRVLKLLYGLRHRRVAEILSTYGFSEKDRAEGWARLSALTTGRLDEHTPKPADPGVLEKLDAWENRWFPITNASLLHRYPGVHAWLFLNLRQTEGLEVAVSVGTFVKRVNKLAERENLEHAKEARDLLVRRGLGRDVLGVAEQLLATVRNVADAPPPPPSPSPEEQQASEDALWNWYLEWSEIARSVIHDRRLLRELGFLQTRGRTSEEEIEEEDGDEVPAAGASVALLSQ